MPERRVCGVGGSICVGDRQAKPAEYKAKREEPPRPKPPSQSPIVLQKPCPGHGTAGLSRKWADDARSLDKVVVDSSTVATEGTRSALDTSKMAVVIGLLQAHDGTENGCRSAPANATTKRSNQGKSSSLLTSKS